MRVFSRSWNSTKQLNISVKVQLFSLTHETGFSFTTDEFTIVSQLCFKWFAFSLSVRRFRSHRVANDVLTKICSELGFSIGDLRKKNYSRNQSIIFPDIPKPKWSLRRDYIWSADRRRRREECTKSGIDWSTVKFGIIRIRHWLPSDEGNRFDF